MSSIAIAKRICKLQKIEFEVKTLIQCPFCDGQAEINHVTDIWSCDCGQAGSVEELGRLVEGDWEDKHKKSFWEMLNTKGVC